MTYRQVQEICERFLSKETCEEFVEQLKKAHEGENDESQNEFGELGELLQNDEAFAIAYFQTLAGVHLE